MKEYKIIFSPESEADLNGIRAYITKISFEYYAMLVLDRIFRKIYDLTFSPERTEPFAENENGRQFRNIVEGKYRIIYTVDRTGSKVVIARIISIGQDPSGMEI